MEAGDLITAKKAERRVLVLENPGLRGQSKIITPLIERDRLRVPSAIRLVGRHRPTRRPAFVVPKLSSRNSSSPRASSASVASWCKVISEGLREPGAVQVLTIGGMD